MKEFAVEYQSDNGSRWISVGHFHARRASGAIAQFMKDVKQFPDLIAVRATRIISYKGE